MVRLGDLLLMVEFQAYVDPKKFGVAFIPALTPEEESSTARRELKRDRNEKNEEFGVLSPGDLPSTNHHNKKQHAMRDGGYLV